MPTTAQAEYIISLYVGYFNRAPDPAGFTFWANAIDSQAVALGSDSQAFQRFLSEDLPQFFAENPEPRSIYPFLSNPNADSAEEFLTSVYQNLFGRNPDTEGMEFYRDALLVSTGQAGRLTPGQAISKIIIGATTAPDSLVVANKIEVGAFFLETLIPKIGTSDPTLFEGAVRRSAETILANIDASESSTSIAKLLVEVTFAADVPSSQYLDGIFFEGLSFQSDIGSQEDILQGLKILSVSGDIESSEVEQLLVVKNSDLVIAGDIKLTNGASNVYLSGERSNIILTGSTSDNDSVIEIAARSGETSSGAIYISDGAQVTVDHSQNEASSSITIAVNGGAEIRDGVLDQGGQSIIGSLIVDGDQTRLSVIHSGGDDGFLSIGSVKRDADGVLDTTQNRHAEGLVVVRNGATLNVSSSINISDGNNVTGANVNGALVVEGQGTQVIVGDESGVGNAGFMRIAEEGGTGWLILRDGANVNILSSERNGGGIQMSGGSDRNGGTAFADVTGEGTVLQVNDGYIRVGTNIGQAHLTVADGAHILANSISAGVQSTGTILIEGVDTRITLGGEAGVGDEGFIRIAEEGGTGSLILRNGAHLVLLPGEEIGGVMQLSGGSDRVGGTAIAEVTGEGTFLQSTGGSIVVGRNVGSAFFTLSDGAATETLYFISGRDGTGTTVIEGEGTSLTLSGSTTAIEPQNGAFLIVGRNTEGTFIVRDGADVTIVGNSGPFPGIAVGADEGGIGELIVTGLSSSIVIVGGDDENFQNGEKGIIEIARSIGSTGEINILDGGRIENDNDGIVVIATQANSNGFLNVNGDGSFFNFGSKLTISPGGSGNGIATVKDDGKITGDELINFGILDVTDNGIVNANIQNHGWLRSSTGIENFIINGDLISERSGYSFDFLIEGSNLLHDTYSATGNVFLNDILFIVGEASSDLEGQIADLITGNNLAIGEDFSVRFLGLDINSLEDSSMNFSANDGIELDFSVTDTTLSVRFMGISAISNNEQVV